MREVEFMAWDKEQKRMCHVAAIDFAGGAVNIVCKDKNGDEHICRRWFDDAIPLEYTGLKDRNGEKIFEGDIVFLFGVKKPTHVVFHRGAFGYYGTLHGGFVSFAQNTNFTTWDDVTYEQVEIVGNIYENPELLDTEKTS